MSRFELIDATSAGGSQFYITDTKTGRSYGAPDSFEQASHALMTLNALKPLWFASTFRGAVYVDVRVEVGGRLYADAQRFTLLEGGGGVADLGLASALASLERRLHKYVALHG